MTSAADLLALQEIDLKRDSRRAIIADADARLGDTEELTAIRDAATEAQTEVDRLRHEQKTIDDAGADLDARIGPMDEKLYGGSVRNPKELSDLQKELESLKARRGKLDDEGLAMMTSLEAATATLNEAKATLRRAEGEWTLDQEDLEAAKGAASGDLVKLDAEREAFIKGMDAPALGLYENLRRMKQGRGVAKVERGTCQGCRLTLPTHMVQRLRSGFNLVQCPSCERILVAG